MPKIGCSKPRKPALNRDFTLPDDPENATHPAGATHNLSRLGASRNRL